MQDCLLLTVSVLLLPFPQPRGDFLGDFFYFYKKTSSHKHDTK
jgi:hypothetical protein